MRKIGIAREPAMRYFSLSLLEIVETKYCNVTPFPLRNRPFSLSVYRRNVVTKCYCADFDLRVEVKRTGIRAKDRASVFFSSLLPRERERERSASDQPEFVHVGLRYNPRVHYHQDCFTFSCSSLRYLLRILCEIINYTFVS